MVLILPFTKLPQEIIHSKNFKALSFKPHFKTKMDYFLKENKQTYMIVKSHCKYFRHNIFDINIFIVQMCYNKEKNHGILLFVYCNTKEIKC